MESRSKIESDQILRKRKERLEGGGTKDNRRRKEVHIRCFLWEEKCFDNLSVSVCMYLCMCGMEEEQQTPRSKQATK
jgi:hypothetical protein